MGEQFNIKDPETVRLARDMARQLGKTVTATVRESLEEKAARREAEIEERKAAISKMAAEFRASLPPELRSLSSREWMDAIYDEDGLPEGSKYGT